MKLSNRLNNFPEYIFSRLGKKVKEVEAKTGKKVLDLGPGSPNFPPSKQYVKKLHEFIDEGDSHLYSGFAPSKEFSEGIQSWYLDRYNVQLEKNELFPLLGAKDGVSHIALSLLDEGDEVLIPDPGYPGFSGPAMMIGAKPIYYDLVKKNEFQIDFKDLQKKVSSKTKFIWVNYPSNPTGQIADMEVLEEVVSFAKKHAIWMVYDNAYAEITFDRYVAPSIFNIPGAKDVAVEMGSFSKMFSFAGYRMGWIVGNHQVVDALAKIKSQVDSGMWKPLQKLGGYALTHYDQEWHDRMIESYKSRRDTIASYLTKLGMKFELTKGSLYIWAEIPTEYKNSEEFSFKLLEDKQILMTPGTGFGKNGEKYVRVSICANIDGIENYFV